MNSAAKNRFARRAAFLSGLYNTNELLIFLIALIFGDFSTMGNTLFV